MKTKISLAFISIPTLFLVLFILNGCSSTPEVISARNNNDIVVDGNQKDWNGAFTPVKDQNVAVSFRNDNDNLYVCLITSDNQKIVRLLSMGLTVWLTPSNSKDMIGIEYPVKKTFEELRQIRGENSNESPADINGRIQNLLNLQNELIIVDENNIAVFSSNPDVDKGFRAKIGYSMNQLVYELKIPLANNKDFTQFVFKANPADEIKVKFEAGKMQNTGLSGDQERGPESGYGGGGRRGGGGMGGGRGGRGGGGRLGGEGQGRNNTPFEYEFKVKLSS